jgi:hypothetical protein
VNRLFRHGIGLPAHLVREWGLSVHGLPSSGLAFEDAGEHELKGVPDRWHLYRVVG